MVGPQHNHLFIVGVQTIVGVSSPFISSFLSSISHFAVDVVIITATSLYYQCSSLLDEVL